MPDPSFFLCAWCREVISQTSDLKQESEKLVSHGICDRCYQQMMGIPHLSQDELDRLPYGLIELDRDGVVLNYNQTEANLACLEVRKVLGKNFFTEVAPCTRVKEFKGHFDVLLDEHQDWQQFEFTFRFPHGAVPVQITLLQIDLNRALVNIIQTATLSSPHDVMTQSGDAPTS